MPQITKGSTAFLNPALVQCHATNLRFGGYGQAAAFDPASFWPNLCPSLIVPCSHNALASTHFLPAEAESQCVSWKGASRFEEDRAGGHSVPCSAHLLHPSTIRVILPITQGLSKLAAKEICVEMPSISRLPSQESIPPLAQPKSRTAKVGASSCQTCVTRH